MRLGEIATGLVFRNPVKGTPEIQGTLLSRMRVGGRIGSVLGTALCMWMFLRWLGKPLTSINLAGENVLKPNHTKRP